MKRISAARQSWLILLGVFLLMWALNAMCYRFYGDDYIYSFVWEGHDMLGDIGHFVLVLMPMEPVFIGLHWHLFFLKRFIRVDKTCW